MIYAMFTVSSTSSSSFFLEIESYFVINFTYVCVCVSQCTKVSLCVNIRPSKSRVSKGIVFHYKLNQNILISQPVDRYVQCEYIILA